MQNEPPLRPGFLTEEDIASLPPWPAGSSAPSPVAASPEPNAENGYAKGKSDAGMALSATAQFAAQQAAKLAELATRVSLIADTMLEEARAMGRSDSPHLPAPAERPEAPASPPSASSTTSAPSTVIYSTAVPWKCVRCGKPFGQGETTHFYGITMPAGYTKPSSGPYHKECMGTKPFRQETSFPAGSPPRVSPAETTAPIPLEPMWRKISGLEALIRIHTRDNEKLAAERDALRASLASAQRRIAELDEEIAVAKRLNHVVQQTRLVELAKITELESSLASAQRDTTTERHKPDEIRAINQAAAYLDSVLMLSPFDQRMLARKLFAIAGNPMADAARVPPSDESGAPR